MSTTLKYMEELKWKKSNEELAANIELQLGIFDDMAKSAEELSVLSNNMNVNLEKYKV